MEATSEYWKPPFYLLEAHGLEVWLVNAKDVKHLPGRPKTDRLDAVWLCKVAERQMIRPSFVPPLPICRLRDLTRYRVALIADRTREKNRVEKLLEDGNHSGPRRGGLIVTGVVEMLLAVSTVGVGGSSCDFPRSEVPCPSGRLVRRRVPARRALSCSPS